MKILASAFRLDVPAVISLYVRTADTTDKTLGLNPFLFTMISFMLPCSLLAGLKGHCKLFLGNLTKHAIVDKNKIETRRLRLYTR